jgi:hypothetical protein
MDRKAVVYFGIDRGFSDRTVYYLYCNDEVKEISEEEYWKLFYERSAKMLEELRNKNG